MHDSLIVVWLISGYVPLFVCNSFQSYAFSIDSICILQGCSVDICMLCRQFKSWLMRNFKGLSIYVLLHCIRRLLLLVMISSSFQVLRTRWRRCYRCSTVYVLVSFMPGLSISVYVQPDLIVFIFGRSNIKI